MRSSSAVESLLFAALDKPTAAERNAFLDTACAGDAALRREVERLLQAHAKVGAFLQKPVVEQLAAAAEPAHDPNAAPDDRAGGSHPAADAAADGLPAVPGYRVVREIARGGMGKVLAAFDLGLGRAVALKILLPGASADRFVREAKITARLPHPGIPPVHALGTLADGSPFLAMKLIAGQTLAQQLKTADRPRWLQAFLQVCQAVGFAHSRGVVHRDLKPANVMVGAFGEVQVMDWGLAKDLTARAVPAGPGSSQGSTVASAGVDANQTTDYRSSAEATDAPTQAGQVMGTPAYMAPEQARGEAVDARSDVFALGGILCAVLTGQPPYRGKSSLEVIQRARAGDLAEAFARLDGCGADAELIALCRACLSATPAERPADGRAIADALTAYLGGVQERLQTAQRERAVALAREAEQRKRRKVQLALAAAVVVLLIGGGAVAFWRNAHAQAGRERDARNAEAVTALLNQCQEALEAGDAAKADVALKAAKKRADEGGAEKEAKRLARFEADLALLHALDEVDNYRWTVVGNTFADPAVAARRTREALAQFGADPEAPAPQDAAARVETSAVRERIVSALDRLLRQEKAAGVRAVLRRVDADPYRDAVRDAVLANDKAKMVDLAGRKAALEQPPGFVAFIGESEVIPVERGRQLLQAAVSQRPGNLGLLMALGTSYEMNKKETADDRLRWFQAATAAAPANHAAHNNLGVALMDKGQVDEAIACYRKAIELDSKDAYAHQNLGNALHDKGKVDEAIACWRKVIELDPKIAPAHTNLGVALKGKGKEDEAIACYRKAIELDSKDAYAHRGLGNALGAKGQVDEAIACFRKVIELDPKDADAHTKLGLALGAKGQVDEAIACFHKAIELDPKNARPHDSLGNALAAKGQVDEAIACWRQAIALDPKYANAHNNLGAALYGKGKVDEAIAYYRKAIALDPKNAKAHYNLSNALKTKGQVDEAITCLRKAIDLDPKLADAHYNLGAALEAKGQVDEAIACYRKAIELGPKDADAHCGLGNALKAKGQVDEAIACYNKSIELDPKNAWAHDSLGIALDARGKQKEAIEAWREAVRLNPRLGDTQYRLGKALLLQGKPSEALGPLQAAANLLPKATARKRHLSADLLAAARQALPEDSPQLAGILTQTGLDLLQQEKWAEAEPLIRQSLAIREKTQPDAWTTFNTKSMLGRALLGQKKYADAEPLLLKGYEGIKARAKTIPKQGGGERCIPEALDRLIELYTALNKPDEAKKWRAERAKYPETKK